jgi:transcriptional antiterminator NusG
MAELTDTTEETAEETEAAVDEAVEESTERAIEETSDVPVEETTDVSVEETSDVPVEETTDVSVEETSDVPVEETTDVSVEETSDVPAEETSDVPVEESAPEVTEASAEEETADAVVEALAPASPYDLPGDWYVIHSYSGYENKVKANLETRIQSMHMEDRIFEVHIPMEDVVEFKGGKKVTVPKKVFPGYILVRMSLDDDSWYAVRNTPGVTGFVAGNAQKPTPLSRREVERFLGVQEEEEKGKPRFKPEWDVGEQVRVVTGPFADFNGVIEELNVDQQKVVVLVNIFGRDTPVELGFEDIQKN